MPLIGQMSTPTDTPPGRPPQRSLGCRTDFTGPAGCTRWGPRLKTCSTVVNSKSHGRRLFLGAANAGSGGKTGKTKGHQGPALWPADRPNADATRGAISEMGTYDCKANEAPRPSRRRSPMLSRHRKIDDPFGARSIPTGIVARRSFATSKPPPHASPVGRLRRQIESLMLRCLLRSALASVGLVQLFACSGAVVARRGGGGPVPETPAESRTDPASVDSGAGPPSDGATARPRDLGLDTAPVQPWVSPDISPTPPDAFLVQPTQQACAGVRCGFGKCIIDAQGQPACECELGYKAVGLECVSACEGVVCPEGKSCIPGHHGATDPLCVPTCDCANCANCSLARVTSVGALYCEDTESQRLACTRPCPPGWGCIPYRPPICWPAQGCFSPVTDP